MKHHQFNKRITNISNDNFASISAKTLKPLLASSVPLLLAIFSVVYALPTHATATLSISVNKTSESLEIIPTAGTSTFSESGTITAYVATTNYTGYKLTITGPNEDGKLVGEDENNILPTIEDELSKEAFSNVEDTTYDNTWGFLPSKLNGIANANYQPSPLSTTATIIDTTSAADNNTYDFSIAVKVNTSLAKDSYSGNFTLALTANPAAYQITYDGNGATSDVPEQQGGDFSSGTTIAISDTIPVKSGYTFKGWCTSTITNDACDGVTITSENNEFTFANITDVALNQITLTALWEKEALYMQTVGTWGSTIAVGSTITAVDTRDGKEYMVGKFKDGKLWMMDNLAFNGKDNKGNGSYIELNNSNTNVSYEIGSNRRWDSSVTSWSDTYTSQKIRDNSTQYSNSLSGVDTTSWKYGVHYNYCAATFGQICSSSNSSSASQSICPYGWKLPDGYDNFYNYYNSYTNFRTALRLPLSGYMSGGSLVGSGTEGYFWASAYGGDEKKMIMLGLTSSSLFPSYPDKRIYGFAIRCIAQ